jgi:hypothetical protein
MLLRKTCSSLSTWHAKIEARREVHVQKCMYEKGALTKSAYMIKCAYEKALAICARA